MVSMDLLEKKPRRIYYALLAFLAFLIPLSIYEVYNRQFMFFIVELIALGMGLSYIFRFRSAFSTVILYRSHLELVRGKNSIEISYARIGFLEELRNYLAVIYIGPKEQYRIHSNHFPGMDKDATKRTVNHLAEQIKKRTGEQVFIKYR